MLWIIFWGTRLFRFFRYRGTGNLAAALTLMLIPANGLAAPFNLESRDGIARYRQKDFQRAEQKFLEAQKEHPNDPKLTYNLANSQYMQGKYNEALQSYTQAAAGKSAPAIKQRALYNKGNALYRLGKLEASAKAYKKALELDPHDMDAKFNLEFVREKIKKNQRRERKNKRKKDSPSGNNRPGENNSSSANEQQDREGETSPGRSPEDSREPFSPEDSSPPLPASPAKEQTNGKPLGPAKSVQPALTKEEAERWLSSLNEDLKTFRQKQAKGGKRASGTQIRDW